MVADGHPYRLARMKDHFNGQLETCLKLKNVTIKEHLAMFLEYQAWVGFGNREGGVGKPLKENNVKRHSVLYGLPYRHACISPILFPIIYSQKQMELLPVFIWVMTNMHFVISPNT
jgi:hypothetical protein